MRGLRWIAGTFLIACIALIGGAQPPTTAPAAASVTLAAGSITISPPVGWTPLHSGASDEARSYELGHGSVLRITVLPVDANIGPDAGPALLKSLQAKAERGNKKIVLPPQLESDHDCAIRLHERVAVNADQTIIADELYLYRMVGGRAVQVVAVTTAATDAEVESVHRVAKGTLVGATGTGAAPLTNTAPSAPPTPTPAGPVSLADAKIRFTVPAGWTVKTTDRESGTVATCHDPADKSRLILVLVQPLPPEARSDPTIRDIVISSIADGLQANLKIDNGKPVGNPQAVADSRFLRKIRKSYDVSGSAFQVTLRAVRVNDVVATVVAMEKSPPAGPIETIADDLAAAITAIPHAERNGH